MRHRIRLHRCCILVLLGARQMSNNYDYENLLGHLEHHGIKEWLLRGARDEDARTIYAAVKRQREHRLARKLAEILTDD
jgi:hypothetical protein